MRTKEVVEGLLYISKNRKHLRDALDVCHVTNYKDRNYTPIYHGENTFLKYFTKPKIVCLIEKRIHVFIIGEPVPTKSGKITCKTPYYLYDIEGDHAHLYTMAKSGMLLHFKNAIYNDYRDFLPDPYIQRIFYIPFQDKENINKSSEESELESINNMDLSKEKENSTIEMFVFNRMNSAGSMLRNSEWINDEDIHNPVSYSKSVKTTAHIIINEILKEV